MAILLKFKYDNTAIQKELNFFLNFYFPYSVRSTSELFC